MSKHLNRDGFSRHSHKCKGDFSLGFMNINSAIFCHAGGLGFQIEITSIHVNGFSRSYVQYSEQGFAG